MRFFVYFLLIISHLTAAGCSKSIVAPYSEKNETGAGNDIAERSVSGAGLDHYYEEWAGVSYREGGVGKDGIDCSAFVQNSYRTLRDINLPRTVSDQAKVGTRVKPSELKVMDLVFFKTGWFQEHVGIYRGDGQFVHVSTKQGVNVADLNDTYWHNHFWQARRVHK